MANGKQRRNGKAFEFAVLKGFYEAQLRKGKAIILESPEVELAMDCYDELRAKSRLAMDEGADAAVKLIMELEPQLSSPHGNDPLLLSLQPDNAGRRGDVRDVLCLRKQNKWEIGLSCKNNHDAFKHPRLSAREPDFAEKWIGIPCSPQYKADILPIFSLMRAHKQQKKKWFEVDKGVIYKPLLDAFKREIEGIFGKNKEAPGKFIHYLLGKNDFYKITKVDSEKVTKVVGINVNGTLNQPSGKVKSNSKVHRLKMPTVCNSIRYATGSCDTLELSFDEGWQISMRIHNAEKEVGGSLKLDVQPIAYPASLFRESRSWR